MINSKTLNDIIHKPISGEWGSEGDNVNVLRTTNFTNEGKLNYSNVVKRNIDPIKVEKKRLKVGDIVIEKSGGSPKQPVGRVVFFDKKGVFLCNNFTAILRPKVDEVVPKYLLYILYSNHRFGFTSAYQNKTTGIINLQLTKYLKGTKIPLPPLEQQKKIAAILDAADAYRQKTNTLIEKYDELTQSLFLDMFGDPFKGDVSPLKNNISIIGGFAFKSKDFIKEGLPLIKIGTVNKGYFEIDNFSFLPKSYLSKYLKWNVKSGDILMSLTGTVGKDDYGNVEKATDHYENYLLNQRVAKLEPSNDVYLKDFLFGMFSNNKTKKELTKISRGVRQANISNRDIENLKMITPSVEDQKLYISAVANIEAQKSQAQASLAQAEDLFNSLLQRAFKGELTS